MKENKSIEDHYSTEYFEKYQKEIGEFGGWANKFKFERHLHVNDTVLDFGCGGGFLLNHLDCKNKVGIELNPVARAYCNDVLHINCFEKLEDVADESIDVIISNHCLEHTTRPYELVAAMYGKLKKKGRIVIVVPLDSSRYSWNPHDVNNHLYSFSPMNLGNILQGCGFKAVKTRPLLHKWPPFYKQIHRIFGETLFHYACWIYGTLFNRRWVQVKGEGIKV